VLPPAADPATSGARFGLFLPQLRMSIGHIEETVRTAEQLGFHSVWFMDHLEAPMAPDHETFEGWTTAAALARRTDRIHLGHLVLCDGFRHPALLAKMAATLDVITEGRLELGLGWGSVPDELARYGFGVEPNRKRALRLAETIEILRKMFSGEPFDHKGRFYRMHDAVGRPRPTHGSIPIHIGGAGLKFTMPLVRHYADWWNCPSYAVDDLAHLVPHVGTARISVQHPVGIAGTRSALEEVAEVAQRRFGNWGGLLVGTPSEITAALLEEARLGAEMFIIQFSDFATPRTLRLFAREVIPAVEAAVSRR
jgi:alkanesulfonate monooxygenase SsuD/methylene tetrahydromethanopterin reductase-like flavin-dependent oxidoreductase (luciferase family)